MTNQARSRRDHIEYLVTDSAHTILHPTPREVKSRSHDDGESRRLHRKARGRHRRSEFAYRIKFRQEHR